MQSTCSPCSFLRISNLIQNDNAIRGERKQYCSWLLLTQESKTEKLLCSPASVFLLISSSISLSWLDDNYDFVFVSVFFFMKPAIHWQSSIHQVVPPHQHSVAGSPLYFLQIFAPLDLQPGISIHDTWVHHSLFSQIKTFGLVSTTELLDLTSSSTAVLLIILDYLI